MQTSYSASISLWRLVLYCPISSTLKPKQKIYRVYFIAVLSLIYFRNISEHHLPSTHLRFKRL